MKKSIEQLLVLAKNPHYKLTEEEVNRLNEYRVSQNVRKNDKSFSKVKSTFKKHKTDIEE